MKTSRFQFEYRESASKLHRAVGEVLRNSESLGLQEIYQEYPVSRVNTNYDTNSHHFDWVIPKLFIVIECHGKQHYTPVAFDGDVDKAVENFRELQKRDRKKKEAALASGYIYVEIPYHLEKKLDEAKLLKLIEVGKEELAQYNKAREEELAQLEEAERIAHEAELARQGKTLADELKEKEKERKAELRRRYLESREHREVLKKARQHRQKEYRRLKELKNGPRQ